MSDMKPAPKSRLEYWWMGLLALPPERESHEYERLRRVWSDPTGPSDWFANPESEVHLTVAAFENFAVLPPNWARELLAEAGVQLFDSDVTACNWSYEFDTGVQGRLPDVTLHARDSEGEALVVVEAKRQSKLSGKDIDPATYLDLPCFAAFRRRAIVYVVLEQSMAAAREQLPKLPHIGCLSWERLAGLQIQLASTLDLEPKFRAFIAGAIQHQFLAHGIRPSLPALPYLASEPPLREVPRSASEGGQTTAERRRPLWKLR